MTSWRMKPTTSALGVIAIVSVMITATASESESGVIGHGINHPEAVEEGRHLHEGEDGPANETIEARAAILFQKNDTATELTGPKDYLYASTTRRDLSNTSDADAVETAELQGDQSDLADPAIDARRPIAKLNVTSEKSQDMSIGESPQSQNDSTTTWKALVESQMMVAPRKIEHLEQLEDHSASDLDDGQRTATARLEKDVRGTTMSSLQETIVAATWPIEQKNVIEDIRAISYQMPSAADTDDQGARQRGALGKSEEETRKEHSRPVNNLLLGGKSTKVFYEIKPSIKTEMERGQDHQQPMTTQKALPGRKFVLPSIDSAFGKFGPYFEDGDQEMNITGRIGTTVLLDCKIGMLGDKEVTWLQHSKDSFRLLTFGMTSYISDQRIGLNFRYPNNWRLQILYAIPRDSGLYKCQVATHPPLVKKFNVFVTAPELIITDDSGRIVPKERHLKAGSALKLRCEARDVLESLNESVVWRRGDETLFQDVSENRTTEILAGREVLVIVSTLIVERASPRHAGNYSCVVPDKTNTTIAVHVLNGELPAAVHDGNGVSRAFLNLWLIHLTMSYVFSR